MSMNTKIARFAGVIGSLLAGGIAAGIVILLIVSFFKGAGSWKGLVVVGWFILGAGVARPFITRAANSNKIFANTILIVFAIACSVGVILVWSVHGSDAALGLIMTVVMFIFLIFRFTPDPTRHRETKITKNKGRIELLENEIVPLQATQLSSLEPYAWLINLSSDLADFSCDSLGYKFSLKRHEAASKIKLFDTYTIEVTNNYDIHKVSKLKFQLQKNNFLYLEEWIGE